MSILFTKKDAFERVKKYLKENQFLFEIKIVKEQYIIKIK